MLSHWNRGFPCKILDFEFWNSKEIYSFRTSLKQLSAMASTNVRMDKEGLKIVELLTFQGKVLSFSREYYFGGRKSAVEHIQQLKNRMSGKLMGNRENDKNNSE